MTSVAYLKRYQKCSEYGFDLTDISSMRWFAMLTRYQLQYTQRKKEDLGDAGAFVWGFRDGHIVTSNDPITGNSSGEYRKPEQGYAGYIGITGTPAFVRKVKAYIQKHADSIKDEAPGRRFI